MSTSEPLSSFLPRIVARHSVLLLAYRPSLLEEALTDEQARAFPHEAGVFLGHPMDDARGFIEHECRGLKCMGRWQV